MKIIKEDSNLVWTDEAEQMLSYYRAGSIDSKLEEFTNYHFKDHDFWCPVSYLKGQKERRQNKDEYDNLVHIMPDGEYDKLKIEFIKKYNTPVPSYNPWTHEFGDNGVSKRVIPDEENSTKFETKWKPLDLRSELGL